MVIPEEMNDDLYDKIEEKYAVLFDMHEELDDSGVHMASITLSLKDGRFSNADVDSKVLGKIVGVVSSDEFTDPIKTIFDAVENPQLNSICHRTAD